MTSTGLSWSYDATTERVKLYGTLAASATVSSSTSASQSPGRATSSAAYSSSVSGGEKGVEREATVRWARRSALTVGGRRAGDGRSLPALLA